MPCRYEYTTSVSHFAPTTAVATLAATTSIVG